MIPNRIALRFLLVLVCGISMQAAFGHTDICEPSQRDCDTASTKSRRTVALARVLQQSDSTPRMSSQPLANRVGSLMSTLVQQAGDIWTKVGTSSTTNTERMHGSCELINKETLCSTRGEPVRRFTFRAPSGYTVNVSTGLRQVVVVRALGQLKMYSPTSEPNREDGTFDLVVRVYHGGVVSQWLDSVPLGGSVPMTWPWPAPLRSDRRNPGHRVGLIAFGIGITELYRTAVQELQDPKVEEVVLLYATKVMEEQQVLDPELEELLVMEPVRFRIERTLTQERSAGARFGRVNKQMLSEVFPWADESRDTTRFLPAGTRQMMDAVHGMLEELGYERTTYALIRDNALSAMFR